MRKLQILLIEDNLLIGELLAEMLVDMGHCVCGVARTEAAAVDAALLTRPDLMIVDAHLVNGSGVSAVATICLSSAVPHIFVTGDRLRLKAGGAVVLQKPYTQADIVDAIERTMAMATGVCHKKLLPDGPPVSLPAG